MPDRGTKQGDEARFEPWWLIATGIAALATLVGALLALALEESRPTAGPFRVDLVGAIILAAGALALAWLIIEHYLIAPGRPARAVRSGVQAIRWIGGLVAVCIGIGVVAVISLAAIATFGGTNDQSTVAVATSAFGIVSAMVGAYLGIKVTSEQAAEAKVQAEGKAAEAESLADSIPAKAKPDARRQARDAGDKARTEARKSSGRAPTA
jgi:hypothetical protein